MGYIDTDRLIAEINKRKKNLRAGICGEAFTRKQKNEMLVASEELDRFSRIIDSLQHEQPEVESQKIKAWIAREWGPNGRLRMFNFLPKKCPCGYEWEGNSWVINDIMPDLSYTNSPIEVELTISILNARKEE